MIDNEVDSCSENSVRIGNSSEVTIPYGSSQTHTGRVEICHNGVYIDVCNDTTDAQSFANRACDSSNPSSTGDHIICVLYIVFNTVYLSIYLLYRG